MTNAFTMADVDGGTAAEVNLDYYRGSFTPEFYPRRYAPKDCLYNQRLDVLGLFFEYVLDRYARKSKLSVDYVEFSYSVRDLCKPWIRRVFQDVQERISQFKFRFLADISSLPLVLLHRIYLPCSCCSLNPKWQSETIFKSLREDQRVLQGRLGFSRTQSEYQQRP